MRKFLSIIAIALFGFMLAGCSEDEGTSEARARK